MGISADQFWQTSKNGKAMLLMLARRGDVEIARDICEWLVDQYEKDLVAGAIQKGATVEQAKTSAANNANALRQLAQSCNDRNCLSVVTSVVDNVFQRHYGAGQASYDKAMSWFANELRRRVRDD